MAEHCPLLAPFDPPNIELNNVVNTSERRSEKLKDEPLLDELEEPPNKELNKLLKYEPEDPLDEEALLSNKSSKISPAKLNKEPTIPEPENKVELPYKSSKISSPSPIRSVIKSPEELVELVEPVEDEEELPKIASSISSIKEPLLDDDEEDEELVLLVPYKLSKISPSREPPVDVDVCAVVVLFPELEPKKSSKMSPNESLPVAVA